MFQQKRVFGGFEAAEPVLDPVPVHLPLVQAEEESGLLASARASQSLGHRGRLLLHFSFDHMIPALPLMRSASIVALVIINSF